MNCLYLVLTALLCTLIGYLVFISAEEERKRELICNIHWILIALLTVPLFFITNKNIRNYFLFGTLGVSTGSLVKYIVLIIRKRKISSKEKHQK